MKKVPENKQRNSLYLTPNEINDGKKLLQKEKEEQALKTNRYNTDSEVTASDLKISRQPSKLRPVRGLLPTVLSKAKTPEQVKKIVADYFQHLDKDPSKLFRLNSGEKEDIERTILRSWRRDCMRRELKKMAPLQVNPQTELQNRPDLLIELMTSTLPICKLRPDKGNVEGILTSHEVAGRILTCHSHSHPKLGPLCTADLEILSILITIAAQNKNQVGSFRPYLRFFGKQLCAAQSKRASGHDYVALRESLDRLQDCRVEITEMDGDTELTRLNFRFLEPIFKFTDKKYTGRSEYEIKFSDEFLRHIDPDKYNLFPISNNWLGKGPEIMKRIFSYLVMKKKDYIPFVKKESDWLKFLQTSEKNPARSIRANIAKYARRESLGFPYDFSYEKNKHGEYNWIFTDKPEYLVDPELQQEIMIGSATAEQRSEK